MQLTFWLIWRRCRKRLMHCGTAMVGEGSHNSTDVCWDETSVTF
jgi:hypothetical protein